jgi:hypothetical protein
MLEALGFFALMEAAGLAAAPLAALVLGRLPGAGLGFAKVLGVLLVGWLVWMACSVGAVDYGPWTIAGAFAVVAALGLLAAMAATGRLVREPVADGQPAFVRPSGRLLALGLIAFCAFLLDGAAYNWSAVYLRDERGAGAGIAAAAFTLLSLALAIGRLFGDRLVARFGRARVVQGCGAVATAGGTLAIVAPAVAPTLAGWALFGLGLSALAPTLLGAAPGTGDAPPAVAIAAVTTIGYLGSFTGPPAIGALAELTGLSAALGLLVAVSLLMSVVAPLVFRPRAPAVSRFAGRVTG